MFRTLAKLSPEWMLRLGLGVMYIYSGFDLINHPGQWHWALPFWLRQLIEKVISINSYLVIQGWIEIGLAVILIVWFMPRFLVWLAALISSIEMAGILILAFIPWSATNFTTTFRDIGLLGASLALTAILTRKG